MAGNGIVDLTDENITLLKRMNIQNIVDRGIEGKFDFAGFCLEIVPRADILVVSCSGFVPEGQIIYAFENTPSRSLASKLFICDMRRLWYYLGIEGITTSLDDTLEFLDSLVSKFRSHRLCAIGSSGGGYMALTIASMLNFERALAISPQTTLSSFERQTLGDTRFEPNATTLNMLRRPYDTKEFIASNTSCAFHIIYPVGDKLDSLHAQRLGGQANVTLHGVKSNEHNVGSTLRGRGVLQECIDAFISSDVADLPDQISRIIASVDSHGSTH